MQQNAPPAMHIKEQQTFVYDKNYKPAVQALIPDNGTQPLPLGTFGRPKFSSRSSIIFNAFRLLRYGNGAFASWRPIAGSACPPTERPSLSLPGIGSSFCRTSYPASVKPNWGDDLSTRAGPPLKNALKPSSLYTVLAHCLSDVYFVSPFRASTCNRVLMTSQGVVRYAAGMPAMAPAVRSWTIPSFFVWLSPKKSRFR